MTILLEKRQYDGPSDADYLRSLWDEAEAGTPEDQYALAEAYRLSTRVSRSQQHAVKWYGMAVSNGSGDAMYRMYQFYRYGKFGLHRDMDIGLDYLHRAAEAGSALAMIDLTWDYLAGKHVQQDFGTALKWAREAYDAVDQLPDDEWSDQWDRAVWYLCCALVAEGSFDSVDEAHHRLYKIKRNDCYYVMEATALIGYINETTCYSKFRGDSYAASNYAWVLRNSYSTQVVCRLADMYYDGRGVEQSYGKALSLYRYAAIGLPGCGSFGNSHSFNDIAAYRLGEICENGIEDVMDPRPDTAEYWYSVSAYRGYGPAMEKIGYRPTVPPVVVDEYPDEFLNFDDVRMMADPETNNYSVRQAVCRILG